MTNLAQWNDGQAVKGEYCGVEYRGTIVDDGVSMHRSRRAPRGNTFIFVVKLDTPITVFGNSRGQIEIWSNDEFNTLEVA